MRRPILSALLLAGAIAGFASGTRHVLEHDHPCRFERAGVAGPDTIGSHGDRGAPHR